MRQLRKQEPRCRESRALAPKQGPSREPWNPLSTASSRRRKSRNGLATASMKFPAREMCAVAIGMTEKAVELAAWKRDRKSTRLNSSHQIISYAVFCLKKKKR